MLRAPCAKSESRPARSTPHVRSEWFLNSNCSNRCRVLLVITCPIIVTVLLSNLPPMKDTMPPFADGGMSSRTVMSCGPVCDSSSLDAKASTCLAHCTDEKLNSNKAQDVGERVCLCEGDMCNGAKRYGEGGPRMKTITHCFRNYNFFQILGMVYLELFIFL